MHKSGFVNIIGNPNVGKSTLMNALVGEKLSIITSKAQTTRHRILGIVNGDDFQIVFSDTPGILKPCYKLQESMMNFVRGALSDADVLLYVTDTVERDDERAAEIIDRIRQSGVPTLVVVNKIDLTTQEALEALVEKWRATLPDAEIIPISAREGFNIAGLFDRILALLPEGYAHGQDAAFLRLGDHPRKDPAQLRQGDPLQLRNRDRGVPRGARHRPHFGRDLRGAQLAEGNPHRAQGREAQKGRTAGPRGVGGVPPEEGLPATLRQSQRRLAQRPAAIAAVRLRSPITAINRRQRALRKQ